MVTTEIKNRIAYIVLDRAEKRNALNDEMVAALKSAFNQAYASDDCKVIVLKAAGEVFSAGADLAYYWQRYVISPLQIVRQNLGIPR